MKTILVTGATGFVGSHMLRYFAGKGFIVYAMGRQEDPPLALREFAEWISCDLTGQIPAIDIDILIHCAGLVDDSCNYDSLYHVNVLGTKKLLEQFHGEHFIYISSASVYSATDKLIHEDMEVDKSALSDYGLSKRNAEEMVCNWNNCRTTILRPRAIYGTHDRVLLPRILKLKKANRIIYPVSINAKVSMTHIGNLCHAVHRVVENQKSESAVYNIADAITYRMHNVIVRLLSQISSKTLSLFVLPRFVTFVLIQLSRFWPSIAITEQACSYLENDWVLSIAKAKDEIGYNPRYSFANSIESIAEWVASVGVNNIATDADLCWKHI